MAQRWDFGSDECDDDFVSDEEDLLEEPRISLKEYRTSQETSSNDEPANIRQTQPVSNVEPPQPAFVSGLQDVPHLIHGAQTTMPYTRMPFGVSWKGPTSYMNPFCYSTRFTVPNQVRVPAQPAGSEQRYSPALITGSSPSLGKEPATPKINLPQEDDEWMSDDKEPEPSAMPDYEQQLILDSYLKDIKKLWAENKNQMSPNVKTALRRVFEEIDNPYLFLTFTVCNFGKGGLKGAHCLPRAVIIEFQRWKVDCKAGRTNDFVVTVPQQKEVLRVISEQFPHYTDDLFRVFNLSEAPLEDRLQVVRDSLSAHKFKEAASYAVKLNVKDHFDVRDILLPLIVLDKINVIQNYLDGSEALQRRFILYLDDTCTGGNERIALLNRLVGVLYFYSICYPDCYTSFYPDCYTSFYPDCYTSFYPDCYTSFYPDCYTSFYPNCYTIFYPDCYTSFYPDCYTSFYPDCYTSFYPDCYTSFYPDCYTSFYPDCYTSFYPDCYTSFYPDCYASYLLVSH